MSISQQISNEQWILLEPILKRVCDPRGRPCKQSQRDFIEAVLWIARTGSPWPYLPPQLGNWNSVFVRFKRWQRAGNWQRLWETLQADNLAGARAIFVDSTMVRTHQHAAGGDCFSTAPTITRARRGFSNCLASVLAGPVWDNSRVDLDYDATLC